ncbi:histone-lysine N-methyltransferase SETMAR [Trichonephila clavipes]|uniref:Histone-lysine N-methyltransferase SETMAR n=1 Tax=Trichonephila clavipes TaxID=2585209 RepID=A0A8X6SF23_TRICX|nr:histone-lysine N-methyltransferase SETMAR [Trichonephila clavipes]
MLTKTGFSPEEKFSPPAGIGETMTKRYVDIKMSKSQYNRINGNSKEFHTYIFPYYWRSVWVPHELRKKNLSDRVRMCSSHPIRHNVEPFLDKLITGDEKWILYENIKRKESYCKPGTLQQQFQNQVSINEKYCFVCGVTGKVQCTLRVAETGKNHQRGYVLQSAG